MIPLRTRLRPFAAALAVRDDRRTRVGKAMLVCWLVFFALPSVGQAPNGYPRSAKRARTEAAREPVKNTLGATFDSARYAARRAAVLKGLAGRVLLVPSREAFKADDQANFKQATDFQYFTGLSDLVGAVLALDGEDRSVVLFLPPANPVLTRARPALGAAGANALHVSDVQPTDSLPGWLARRFTRAGILVSPTDVRGAVRSPIPMAGSVTRWAHYLTSLGFNGEVSPATPVTRALREIKEADEITVLARVATLSGKAMLAGMRALKPGRAQRDVEMEIVGACVRGGGVHSFWPWAMSGPRGVYTDLYNSFVDYDGHNRAMQRGELVRVDVGCQLEQYMGDVGRTAPVSGRFTAGQREAWDLLIEGYRAGLSAVRDGARVSDIFDHARQRVRERASAMRTALGKRAADELLSPRGSETWQFHGVGLDDAEGAPAVLKAGMVVAYEIMYALEGEGFYLEDMLLVEPNGFRNLSAGLPYSAAEIERAMARRR